MNISNEYDHIVKLIVVGDRNVGKTKFIQRFVNNKFSNLAVTTTCIDLIQDTRQIDNQNIRIQIWDTAGQERFHAISRTLYAKAQAIILMFDVTEYKSFERLEYWFSEIKDVAINLPITIIANKVDLLDNRVVSPEEIEDYCKKKKVPFYESSAKDDINVTNVFEKLTQEIIKNKKDEIMNGTSASYGSRSVKSKKDPRDVGCCW